MLSIFFSCLGAYTLSRPKLMFKKLFTLLVVFTMYFSGGMIPKFLVVKGVGLYNTRMAVILPGVISTWNMIVMRTSFRAIPQSLEESARLEMSIRDRFTSVPKACLTARQSNILPITRPAA